MDEKEIDVFKQVGPIVNDVNELLKRVKRLDQQIDISDSKGKPIRWIRMNGMFRSRSTEPKYRVYSVRKSRNLPIHNGKW